MNYTVAERLMRYVQIDTEADPNSGTTPSSLKQKKPKYARWVFLSGRISKTNHELSM